MVLKDEEVVQRKEICLVLDWVCKGSEIVKEPLADLLDLFFAPLVGVGWRLDTLWG